MQIMTYLALTFFFNPRLSLQVFWGSLKIFILFPPIWDHPIVKGLCDNLAFSGKSLRAEILLSGPIRGFDSRLQLEVISYEILLSQERPSLKNSNLSGNQVAFLECCTEASDKEVALDILILCFLSLQYKTPI